MELTQAMQILGIAEGQQISDEVAEAIRTVLAEMKKPKKDVVEVVRCKDCKHQYGLGYPCQFTTEAQYDEDGYCEWDQGEFYIFEENDFCSYGERK